MTLESMAERWPAQETRFEHFETDELRWLIDVIGETTADDTVSQALYDECWREIHLRATEHDDREAADLWYN